MKTFNNFIIDKNLKPHKAKVLLYKNKNECLGEITNFIHLKESVLKLSQINTLDFNIPYYLSNKDTKTKNKYFEKVKYMYYVKLIYGGFIEWYTVEEINKSSKELIKSIKCYSTPYKLRDDKIYKYEVEVFTLQDMLNGNIIEGKTGILENTNWSLGYIDSTLKNKRRSLSITSKTTILDVIFKIAETFNAIIEWDTENQKINFYDEETYGQDNGLVVQYNKYLDSLQVKENVDEMTTVLSVEGKNGATIAGINPSGQSYLSDYSFFMYPFERDEKKNVIRHSDYMSDSLCNALLDFQNLVNKNKGALQELINKSYLYNTSITQKEIQLTDLQGEYEGIIKKLNIAQSNDLYKDSIIKEKEIKFKQIQEKEKEIEFIKKQKQSVKTQIDSIKFTLSEENNFTPLQIAELREYTKKQEYHNKNIEDEKQLYLASVEYFQKLKQPKTILTLNIVNFLELVEAQNDWDKLKLGDIVTINYHRFNIDKVKNRIMEIKINYENKGIDISIANVTNVSTNNKEKMVNSLYSAIGSSPAIEDTRQEIGTIKDITNNLQETITNAYKQATRQLYAGSNNSTIINYEGLTSWNDKNKKMGVRINNGNILVTNEGENDFRSIIDGNGLININAVTGEIEEGNDIRIPITKIFLDDGEQLENKIKRIDTNINKLDNSIIEQADKQIQMAEEQIQKADELTDYIDSVNNDFGLFKIETDKMFATKVSSEDFKSYRIQTDKELADVVRDTNNKIESYRTQTANMIADKVSSSTFYSYRTQTNNAIADKVSSGAFSSYRTQIDREIQDRVTSSDFQAYTQMTDRKIGLVVTDSGTLNTASIITAIKNDESIIQMIADRVEIKPRTGIIEFPNGCDIDTNSGGIRMRNNSSCYINVNYDSIALYCGSGSATFLFHRDGMKFNGRAVKLQFY